MPGRRVQLVKPHSLSVETAQARLKAMVNSPRTDSRIRTGSFAWDDKTKTFTVDLIAYGASVHATAALTPGLVTVRTNEIEGFYPTVAFGVWRAEVEIDAMLDDALKP